MTNFEVVHKVTPLLEWKLHFREDLMYHQIQQRPKLTEKIYERIFTFRKKLQFIIVANIAKKFNS